MFRVWGLGSIGAQGLGLLGLGFTEGVGANFQALGVWGSGGFGGYGSGCRKLEGGGLMLTCNRSRKTLPLQCSLL